MAMRTLQHVSTTGNVKRVDYDVDAQTLLVTFKGGTYQVEGVDEGTALGFESASSAGQYYNVAIKGQYVISRV